MTFKEMIDQVISIVQEPSFTSEYIGAVINRGIQMVCAGVLLPGKYEVSPPMPDLYKTDTIDTVVDAGVVDLPADFGRNLTMVVNDAGDAVPIEPSFRRFLSQNPAHEDGDIRICSVQGKRLMYRDVPTSDETLTLHYYARPDDLEDEEDTPDYIPEGFHYSLLVAYAAKELFNLIEDGISSPKVNTPVWTGIFHQAVHDLGVFLGEDGVAVHVVDCGDYIS